MVKTKTKKSKQNVTKKRQIQSLVICPIGLKPFEEKFSKTTLRINQNKNHKKKMKNFSRELLSKFSPNSIKPKNNFYDYINYQWLKNVSLEQQQKYIVQIDDF